MNNIKKMELTKITPSEILELVNTKLRHDNFENGYLLDAGLMRFVTCDKEGIFCYEMQPTLDNNGYFEPHISYDGTKFNTKGYEVVGLKHGQMFADYSI